MKLKHKISLLILCTITLGIYYYLHPFFGLEKTTHVPIKEYSNQEYKENPSATTARFQRYNGRKLTLHQKGEDLYDFVLSPKQGTHGIATITLHNVDMKLFVPTIPKPFHGIHGLETIALIDREWNRQQVSFKASSQQVTIRGGDGYELSNLYTVELAKNCLNAGLWEIILTEKEKNKKGIYYQGWFTFPMNHYKHLFETFNQKSWWTYHRSLYHWKDPEGKGLELSQLRKIKSTIQLDIEYNPQNPILVGGEQIRKMRTVNSTNIRTWGDIYKKEKNQTLSYASFVPPGIYKLDKPWKHRYNLIKTFKKGHRNIIKSPLSDKPLDEIVLIFQTSEKEETRLIIGGISLKDLPKLSLDNYDKGLYMPMGISIPPFYQSYKDLVKNPPQNSPYYSFIINEKQQWLDHHTIAVDGPIMFRDIKDPNTIHILLMSYERHALIFHATFELQ